MTQGTLDDRLAALVGQPIGGTGPSHGPDPVNAPMIRHWAAAFEDWNPVYTDPEAAKRSRFGEIVAPPLMLQTWTMATPRITGMAERGGSPTEGGRARVLDLLDEAGFVGTLASNSEFEILRYLSERRDRVVHRDELLREIWGIVDGSTTRSVDFAVARLRRKIEPNSEPRFLRTVHGDGYSLTVDRDPA